MNKNLLLFILIIVFIIFRFSTQGNDKKANTKVDQLLEIANSYAGAPYKFGGTTKNGMDCSGLVSVSFKEVGIQLPRSSKAMSATGIEIPFDDVRVGDLLFFDIARLKGKINHVGLVILILNDEVFFMHSTTSKGVITSSMNESYWKNEFVKATRVL